MNGTGERERLHCNVHSLREWFVLGHVGRQGSQTAGMQSGGSAAEELLRLPSEFTSASVRCVRMFPSPARFRTHN